MLFNPIDWTEISEFDKPLSQLADYLNDERVFGIHLWTARNQARSDGEGAPLNSLLIDHLHSFPSLTNLADRFNTDKNRHTGNRHAYARVYDGCCRLDDCPCGGSWRSGFVAYRRKAARPRRPPSRCGKPIFRIRE